jgi:ketosteroid isomerase-like protein
MSRSVLEMSRRLFDDFQAGLQHDDPGEWLDHELVADDFEWILSHPVDGRTVWPGRSGFVEFINTWTEQFEDWSMWVERWIDAHDDRVVALTRQSATGRGSGVPVELNLGIVWEWEAGRLARGRAYLTHAEALEAEGLSE